MTTRMNNVGKSASNPSKTVHPVTDGEKPPADKEVMGPVSGDIVQGPGTAPVSAPSGVIAAVQSARTGLRTLLAGLAQYQKTPTISNGRIGPKVDARRLGVIPRVAEILREYPQLASDLRPEDMVTEANDADAMLLFATDLKAAFNTVMGTVRQGRADAWAPAGAVYAAARHRAKSDPGLATKVAPIRDALKKGPRTDTTVATASAASHRAGKAQAKATRAQQKAAVASRAQVRAAQAHADRHPTATTTPVANPQGPAAGADVNPQGPSR